MFNFSGIWYRIWGVSGIILFLGVILLIFSRFRPNKPNNKKDVICAFIVIAFAICMGSIYASRIISPDISSYTGKFVDTHRNSRVAPPLPLTSEFVFWNGEGKKQTFYLDAFSRKEIFPYEFTKDQEYLIYFDDFTNVIVRVEIVE